MLVFGHDGFPVILFPTAKGRYFEGKDSGLTDSASNLLDSGKIKIYCPDGIDADSWYNYSIHPSDRVNTHLGYENIILYDVIEFAKHETGKSKVGLAGCNFGAYHAANIAFKHPELINYLICLGGAFDIKPFITGYYDEDCYFNNPPDYLPNLTDNWYLHKFGEMGIFLGVGEWDNYLDQNRNLSGILNSKNVNHWLDVQANYGHDWNLWRQLFPKYLGKLHE